jgi:hypothetical protein
MQLSDIPPWGWAVGGGAVLLFVLLGKGGGGGGGASGGGVIASAAPDELSMKRADLLGSLATTAANAKAAADLTDIQSRAAIAYERARAEGAALLDRIHADEQARRDATNSALQRDLARQNTKGQTTTAIINNTVPFIQTIGGLFGLGGGQGGYSGGYSGGYGGGFRP